jgi:hypothetical protein
MGRSRLTKLDFSINPGDDGMLEDPENNGKIKNILILKEKVLTPNPLLCSRRRSAEL